MAAVSLCVLQATTHEHTYILYPVLVEKLELPNTGQYCDHHTMETTGRKFTRTSRHHSVRADQYKRLTMFIVVAADSCSLADINRISDSKLHTTLGPARRLAESSSSTSGYRCCLPDAVNQLEQQQNTAKHCPCRQEGHISMLYSNHKHLSHRMACMLSALACIPSC